MLCLKGATKDRYTPTADDIGSVVKAQIRSSEVDGCVEFGEIGPVRIDPKIAAGVLQRVEKLEAEFEVQNYSSVAFERNNLESRFVFVSARVRPSKFRNSTYCDE